jgi:TonB family protein
MSGAHEFLARAALWLWPAIANHLWQATLLAALVLCATLLLRRAPARVRHALWLVASAKFVLPSALFALLAGLAGFQTAWLSGAAEGAGRGASPLVVQFVEPLPAAAADEIVVTVTGAEARHNELFCALTLVWLAGVVALLAVWMKRRRVCLRALREGREVFAGREFDAMESARALLGLRRDVLLICAQHEVEPGVWRTRRPVVVLPRAVAEHLDDEELEALMLHELAHVERRDNLYANLQAALSCVFWFCPIVWLIGRRTLAERERACDERVLEVCGAASAYASSILKVVRFCFGWRVAGVSGAAAGSNLRRRIEMILHDNTGRKLSTLHRAILCVAATAALALSLAAGLVGSARGVGAQNHAVSQDSSRIVTSRGGAARRAEDGPAVREIMSAPESVVYFEQTQGAPITITDARVRLITNEQLRRAEGEGADFFDETEASQHYVTLPTIALTNVSGKAIKEVGVGFNVSGQTRVIMGYAAAMRPGESQTFKSDWNGRNAIIPGHLADVSVRVVWATFADGTQWGARARTPHPPEPPAPGRISVRGSASVESGAASGIGTGYGVGDGVGSGSGSGSIAVGGSSDGVGSGGGIAISGGGVGVGGSNATGGGIGKGGGVAKAGGLRGQALSLPNPKYPAIARAARAEGAVGVKVLVDEEGNVVGAEVVSGHPLLRSAAVAAARAAKFKPMVVEGKPAKVAGLLTYVFALSNEDDPEHKD